MAQHALPHQVDSVDDLLCATTYVVQPSTQALSNAGLSWQQQQELNIVFLVTREMLVSLRAYMDALQTAGFAEGNIGLDIDGKAKLVRNNWLLLTYGSRRVREDMRENRWVQTFSPFGVLLAPSEAYIHHLYAVLALKEACKRVLKRDLNILAQNTDAHKSTVNLARMLPIPISTLCYPHIARAPVDRKNRKYLRGKQKERDNFTLNVISPDLRAVQQCKTVKQVQSHTMATHTHQRPP
jgi:hypothetical protein